MGSAPTPPAPPDPKVTAAAQTGSNVNTAVAQSYLNNTNQVTPYGNLNYSQTGTRMIDDGNGNKIPVPQWTATQTLSPEEQNLFNLNEATKGNVAQIGLDASGRIGNLLSQPVDLSTNATEGRLFDLANTRLAPELQRQWNDRETQLMNRGIMPGSEGYTQEQDAFNRQKNDLYNQLYLSGHGQAVGDILQERNQPINEISALMSGSQVSNPNYVNSAQTQVQPTNVIGAYQDAYNAQMANYQAQMQQKNAMMGGLFGLGAAGLGMFRFSDRRLKTDIEKIGKTDEGTPIYSYRYKAGGPPEIGFMAQDIEKKVPGAVVNLFGLKAVNYKAAVEGGA